MEPHNVVSHGEWIAARKAYLAEEKAFTRARDELSRKRRALPWERVEKNYMFDTPDGKQSLADLFGGKGQLIIYHFMLGPTGKPDARAVHSLPIISTARSFISHSATCRSSSPRGRRCRSSKHSSAVWAGASNGCRHSAAISTMTIKSR